MGLSLTKSRQHSQRILLGITLLHVDEKKDTDTFSVKLTYADKSTEVITMFKEPLLHKYGSFLSEHDRITITSSATEVLDGEGQVIGHKDGIHKL